MVDRDPESEAVVAELVRLTGPGGADMSDREIEAEMDALGVKVSHERLRQVRNDEWEEIQRVTRRKLRTYVEWKRANPSVWDAGGGRAG